MTVFAKIFAQIFDSSISSDYVVRHVFMDLLVLADRDGVVDMTLDAISRRTNVPEEIVSHAISELMKADIKSRSHNEEGARLIPIDSHRDWGWQIVNYEHYRNIKDEEARRTYFRDRQREHRAKSKTTTNSQSLSNDVKDSSTLLNKVTQAEADTDTEAKEQKHSPNPRKRVSEAQKRRDKKKRDSPPTKTDFSLARHKEFKAGIFQYWQSKNEIGCPWGPAEGAQLEMWLKANPNVTFLQFKQMLRHRYLSDVTHSDRPAMWIKNVTSYANGPIDQYGKPLRPGGNNGTGKNNQSPASQRVKANRQVLAEIAIKRGLYTPPSAFESDGEPLPESGFDGCDAGVRGGLAETDPEILPPESRNGG
jgi:hypothetical protein